MNLHHLSDTALCSRLKKMVKTERKLTHLILWHILEVEERRLYAERGFESMFAYLTQELGYGESSAYPRLQAARLLKKVPEAADKLESGALKLSQMVQVQACLRQERKDGMAVSLEKTKALLQRIENQNSFQTKKVLAEKFNRPIQTQEVIKPQRDDSVRMELTFSPEQLKELEQARHYLSHSCPTGSWAEVLAILAQKYNQTKRGRKKVSNQTPISDADLRKTPTQKNKSARRAGVPSNQDLKIKRAPIPLQVKRELLQKSQHQCEYRDPLTQRRCEGKHFLEVDHEIPLALGGEHGPDNFRILCRNHNQFAAWKQGLIKNHPQRIERR